MAGRAEVLDMDAGGLDAMIGGSRPLRANKRTGQVQVMTERGIVVNSLLREDEWQELDKMVKAAALYPLRFVNFLRSKGLVQPLGGLATLQSTWYGSSEMTAATINMTGRGRGERDLPELKQFGVPVPITFKEFSIGKRMLLASRRMGDGIDLTAAAGATRVVAESVENMFINGNGSVLNGTPLYGIRNHPNRITDTATNFGGGVWSTITNIVPTVSGMINAAMVTAKHYGPYVLFLPTTQYNIAANSFYTDNTGQTPLERIRKLAGIEDVIHLPNDVMTAGEAALIQTTADVIDVGDAMPIQALEWTSGDGFEALFKIFAVTVPRIKATNDGKTGIVHATGLAA